MAVLMSTGNTVSNLTGIFIPLVATMFRTRFGAAWVSPFFAAVSIFHMLCAGVFCVLARVDSARCLQTAVTMQEKMSSIRQQVADAGTSVRALDDALQSRELLSEGQGGRREESYSCESAAGL